MNYKPLYVAYTDDGYLGEYRANRFGLIYDGKAVNNIKVVACPFCGVSTSNGEKMYELRDHVQFRCSSCGAIAFSTNITEIVTAETVKSACPYNFVPDDAVFHLVKINIIVRISNSALLRFSTEAEITNSDVIEFYNNIEDFKKKNNIDAKFNRETVREFLRHNQIAKKYDIGYEKSRDTILSLRVYSYNLTDVNFYLRQVNVVTFAKDGIDRWVILDEN